MSLELSQTLCRAPSPITLIMEKKVNVNGKNRKVENVPIYTWNQIEKSTNTRKRGGKVVAYPYLIVQQSYQITMEKSSCLDAGYWMLDTGC